VGPIVSIKVGPNQVDKRIGGKLCFGDEVLYPFCLLLYVGVGSLEIHEWRGQQDNYVRVFHALDLTKLVTRQVDEWRRNAEGVGVGCWLDKGVHQLQITLKGQHITAECGYPCRSDFRRESARAFHPVAELGLYPASEVL